MNLEEFTGLTYLETSHDEFYGTVIEKIGLSSVMNYVPFSNETLEKAYEEDKHFNTRETPIKTWDNATGTIEQSGLPYGLAHLLTQNGINQFSTAQCVCILKCAARQTVLAIQSAKQYLQAKEGE